MLHGSKASKNSEEAAREAFSGKTLGSNLPSIKIRKKDLDTKINIINLSNSKYFLIYIFVGRF